jgi:hypothetical protein
MTDDMQPPTEPTPDPTGETPRDQDESLTAETTTSPALGTAEATDAAIAALAAARAAALLPPQAPPVVDAATAPPAIVDPTEIDVAEAAPAATEIAATTPVATAPVGTEASATPAVAAALAPTAPAATVLPQEAPAAAAVPGRRRTAAGRAMRSLGVVVLGVALFVGGVALGTALYQNLQPAPVDSVGVAIDGGDPPPVAQEFISALAANDADALRSSLDQEPHLDLTREMTKFGIQRVDNVEILGTQVDGNRSATEILMQYESTDGAPFAINLVILVDGGKIEGFR